MLNQEDELTIENFYTDSYLVQITEKGYNCIMESKKSELVDLYHLANACIKIIENHNLNDELRELLRPILVKQRKILEDGFQEKRIKELIQAVEMSGKLGKTTSEQLKTLYEFCKYLCPSGYNCNQCKVHYKKLEFEEEVNHG